MRFPNQTRSTPFLRALFGVANTRFNVSSSTRPATGGNITNSFTTNATKAAKRMCQPCFERMMREHSRARFASAAGPRERALRAADCRRPRTGVYNVVIEFCAEHATRFLLGRAVALVESVIRGEDFPVRQIIEEANEIAADTELGPSTRSIVDAAAARGIPWSRGNDQSLVRLGYGKHLRLIQAAMTDGTSAIGVELAGDKDMTKARLARASIPVPAGETVRTEEEAVAAISAIGEARRQPEAMRV